MHINAGVEVALQARQTHFLQSLTALEQHSPNPVHLGRAGAREWILGLLDVLPGDENYSISLTDEVAAQVLCQPGLQLTLATTPDGPDVQTLFFHTKGMAVGLLLDIQRASSKSFIANGLREGFAFSFGHPGSQRHAKITAELSPSMPPKAVVIAEMEKSEPTRLCSQEVAFATFAASLGKGACQSWAASCGHTVEPGHGVFISVFDRASISKVRKAARPSLTSWIGRCLSKALARRVVAARFSRRY